MDSFLLFLTILVIFNRISSINSSISLKPQSSRNSRAFAFYTPYNTGIALGVAIAVPLDNGRGDVEASICIEANLNQPNFEPELDPPPFKTIAEGKYFDNNEREVPTKSTGKRKVLRKLLKIISRRAFFTTFIENIKHYGFNGKHCLLKAVCETTQHQFGKYNGLVGDIIHVLFTPSTSKDEEFSKRLYEAENHGNDENCDSIYGEKCPISVLDLITSVKSLIKI